jgi:glycosyltransferase involved in cell wall biosynthesis
VGMCDHLTGVLQRKSGLPHMKFRTIMNGYDRDDFKNVFNVGLNERFTITHCGSISRVSDPEPFLTAVGQLFAEDMAIAKQLYIQFIGTDIFGHLRQLLLRWNLSASIAPIQYHPHHEALKKLMASHLLLLTIFKKTDEEIITGKIFEYFASGKPILLITDGGYIAETVTRLHRGTVVKTDDLMGIKKAISFYYDLYRKNSLPFHKPLSLSEFDREYLAGKLAAMFSEIT